MPSVTLADYKTTCCNAGYTKKDKSYFCIKCNKSVTFEVSYFIEILQKRDYNKIEKLTKK
jgi:hypothetical protein